MIFYISKNGLSVGPLTDAQVRAGVKSGQFQTTDLALVEGTGEWKPLHEALPVRRSTTKSFAVSFLVAVIFIIFGMAFVGMLGGIVENNVDHIPGVYAIHNVANIAIFVSLLLLVVGLIKPELIGGVATKLFTRNSLFPNGVRRKHVGYGFGTIFLLSIGLAGGTDMKQIEIKRQNVLAQQTAIATEARARAAKIESLGIRERAQSSRDRE